MLRSIRHIQPRTLAATAIGMYYRGVFLHRVVLNTLRYQYDNNCYLFTFPAS